MVLEKRTFSVRFFFRHSLGTADRLGAAKKLTEGLAGNLNALIVRVRHVGHTLNFQVKAVNNSGGDLPDFAPFLAVRGLMDSNY